MSEQLLAQAAVTNSQDVIGEIAPPPGVANYNELAGGATTGIGLLIFISNLIRIGTVVAGLWVLFNFVTAGFDYITAGDSKANEKVRQKLTSSFMGLAIIIASYIIIGVAGVIFFGRADYFVNPSICGPDSLDASGNCGAAGSGGSGGSGGGSSVGAPFGG